MDNADLILAIDNGTQSLKAIVFDLNGRIRCRAQEIFQPYVSPKPGWAEQDPRVFWEALCRACQYLWQELKVPKKAIAGVTVTAQRGTVINLDRTGQPLRPAILWLDQRKTHGLPPLQGPWRWLFSLIGQSDTIAYFRSEAEANWLAAYQADVWDRTYKFLLLSGYLTYCLTGRFVDSYGGQVGYLPFNFRRFRWASAWDWKWRCLAVQREMLPELMAPGAVLGHISAQAAVQTGIPEGLPVIAAAADKACEVIGSGALDTATGCLSYGTTATINVTHPRYVEPIPLLPAYPAAVPGFHTVEVEIFRGYWMVNWFKEEFGHPERAEAEREGVTAEALFERFLEKIPPTSMGLMLQPYWSPGLKSPGPEAKGAIIGFGDVHTRAHVYRSILEGLAYALREGLERIEKRSRHAVTSLRVSGGGSQSRSALQLTADIFGLPTIKPHIYETAGLGAAIDAAVGLGFYPDFSAAVNAMTHVGEVFEPDPANHRLYDRLYRQVYRKMYRRLKPLYEKIRTITGYPE